MVHLLLDAGDVEREPQLLDRQIDVFHPNLQFLKRDAQFKRRLHLHVVVENDEHKGVLLAMHRELHQVIVDG